MPRKGSVSKRSILADPVYESVLVAQFINKVMIKGKKSKAEKVVYEALNTIGQGEGVDPVGILQKAVDNVRPLLEVRSRRVGGATYQVPVEVKTRRSRTLAVRWIVAFSRIRREKTMAKRLTAEVLDAANRTGYSVKKKEDLHRMAEANKAFAHYRW
ncbi:MAG: 30S ribosomal protein S7 [Actinobacteria bacterium]|nr:30S ribosomal protein S7 [Actinomycetota bacterium]MCG2817420.1 30S ribosomal protein S7 [Actinomycetes bacterium]MBU4218681.1 30S ribosomal protein S7 [Actinomycetota bacterium]MBU4359356.1 30S ribosomal protein S7 [Actinomycetota bacterium]MBU4392921.1 30S ribosomal protein S7 [Actinomycetota bacterium]